MAGTILLTFLLSILHTHFYLILFCPARRSQIAILQHVVFQFGFARQPWWDSVKREVEMTRNAAGIIDISNFANYVVSGADAESWLNALFANRMPKSVGRSCLTPLIGSRGGIAGDMTVTRLDDDLFWIIGSWAG